MDILSLQNNYYCSERISPRRLRGNKILPPECHSILQSYCNQRISPRRERNGCEEFAEDVLLSNISPPTTPVLSRTSSTTSSPSPVLSRSSSSSSTRSSSSFTPESIQREGSPEIIRSVIPDIPFTRVTIVDVPRNPLPFRGRGEFADVLKRSYDFRDEMIDIESVQPYLPQRDIAIDLATITGRFEIVMQKGLFEEEDQVHLFDYLDNLSQSTTEVLQKNIDIEDIQRKTIQAYTDAKRLILESLANEPERGPITIQTTGDIQAVLNEARRVAESLKSVTPVVSEQPTETGTGTVSVIDETARPVSAESIGQMIDTIFDAFDTVVDRGSNN